MSAARSGPALTVVKLGGSFAFSPELPRIVAAIASADMPLVIVPGGGPFADAVRDAQPRMGFDDGAAHRMALMAMAQFAECLAAMAPRITVAAGLAAVELALREDLIPVFSPWPMTDGVEALPATWDLTSDSIALWLSRKLEARRLLLLKSCDPPTSVMIGAPASSIVGIGEAAEAGLIDPLFPHYARNIHRPIWWIGPADFGELADILKDHSGSQRQHCRIRLRFSRANP